MSKFFTEPNELLQSYVREVMDIAIPDSATSRIFEILKENYREKSNIETPIKLYRRIDFLRRNNFVSTLVELNSKPVYLDLRYILDKIFKNIDEVRGFKDINDSIDIVNTLEWFGDKVYKPYNVNVSFVSDIKDIIMKKLVSDLDDNLDKLIILILSNELR